MILLFIRIILIHKDTHIGAYIIKNDNKFKIQTAMIGNFVLLYNFTNFILRSQFHLSTTIFNRKNDLVSIKKRL